MIKIKGSEGKKYRRGFFKRLVRESLILSCLGRLSDRVTSIITGSILFRIFCGCEEADEMLKNGFLGRAFKKNNANKSILNPIKMICSKATDDSKIIRTYRKLINLVLSVPIRFYGILFFTFGLYSTGIFFAKHFSVIYKPAEISELFWSVLIAVFGSILLFCGKSAAQSLRTSRIFRWLFISVLGVKDITLKEKRRADVRIGTLAFVLGTVLGVSSVFINPALIVIVIVLAAVLASLMYMPELGLMSCILLFPLVSVKILALIFIVTIVSYIFKLLRAKRNIEFKAADIFVIFFGLFTVATGVISGSGGQIRACYMICFLIVYFLISNLIVSKTLLRQMFYSLCIGAGASSVLYIFAFILKEQNSNFNVKFLNLTEASLVSREGYGFFMIIMVPLCVSFLKSLTKKSERAGIMVLLSLVTVSIFIRADRETYMALFAVLLLYSLFSLHKPIITIASYGITALVLYFAIPYIPNIGDVFGSPSNDLLNTQTIKLIIAYMITGVGIGNDALVKGLNIVGSGNSIGSLGLFERLLSEGGLFYFTAFLIAAYLVLQRAFYCISRNLKNGSEYIQAAMASSVILFLALGVFFDMWNDIRIFLLFWTVCGMITAVKNVYGRFLFVRGEKERI